MDQSLHSFSSALCIGMVKTAALGRTTPDEEWSSIPFLILLYSGMKKDQKLPFFLTIFPRDDNQNQREKTENLFCSTLLSTKPCLGSLAGELRTW